MRWPAARGPVERDDEALAGRDSGAIQPVAEEADLIGETGLLWNLWRWRRRYPSVHLDRAEADSPAGVSSLAIKGSQTRQALPLVDAHVEPVGSSLCRGIDHHVEGRGPARARGPGAGRESTIVGLSTALAARVDERVEDGELARIGGEQPPGPADSERAAGGRIARQVEPDHLQVVSEANQNLPFRDQHGADREAIELDWLPVRHRRDRLPSLWGKEALAQRRWRQIPRREDVGRRLAIRRQDQGARAVEQTEMGRDGIAVAEIALERLVGVARRDGERDVRFSCETARRLDRDPAVGVEERGDVGRSRPEPAVIVVGENASRERGDGDREDRQAPERIVDSHPTRSRLLPRQAQEARRVPARGR